MAQLQTTFQEKNTPFHFPVTTGAVAAYAKRKSVEWDNLPPAPWALRQHDTPDSSSWMLEDALGNDICIFTEFNLEIVRLFMAAPHLARALEGLIQVCEENAYPLDQMAMSTALMMGHEALSLVRGA